MENNFYVGDVFHRRRIKSSYVEKIVLYTDDALYYLDLISGNVYTTESSKKDYVIKDSLLPTDISDYNTDYMYLLNRKRKVKVKNTSSQK